MSLHPQGFLELERISREFLWGKNELGEFKKPLVAWKDTALNKAEGGVGFDDVQSTSLVLKMRLSNRILADEDVIWVQLAKASMARSLKSGFRRRTRKHWSVGEALLLDVKFHVMGSPLFRDVVRGFNKAREHLHFMLEDSVLPAQFIVEQSFLLFHGEASLTPAQIWSLLGILNQYGIKELRDLRAGIAGWKDVAYFRQSTRCTRQGDDVGLVWLLEKVSKLAPPSIDMRLQNSNGWRWTVGNKDVKNWTH